MRVTFRPLERDDFPDPRTLDLIMWSLRLPLLWEQAERVDDHATPGEQAAEHARLDALITEGERALGILPPEEAS